MVKKDIRIAAHHLAYSLFYYLYHDNGQAIENLVLQMYNSKYDDVSEVGAMHVANMHILYNCFEDVMNKHPEKTAVQKSGIIKVAVDLLKYPQYHDKCKIILESFLDDEDNITKFSSHILYRESVNITDDLEFIIKLVTAKSNRLNLHCFIDFINKNELSIEVFKDIIFGMCDNIIRNTKGETNDFRSELYGIIPDLSSLIVLLYDKTKDNFEVSQQCLDIWDMMFENNIGSIYELSKSIMNY